MTSFLTLFFGVGLVFYALAKLRARPGFNALALGLFLAATPFFSQRMPPQVGAGSWRDLATVTLFLVASSLGTALGGGLRAREDDHDHSHPHTH